MGLKKLKGTAIEDLWRHDLDEFMKKLDEVEAAEMKERNEGVESSSKGYKKTGGGSKKGQVKVETLPSSHAIRIEPRIDDELKAKAAKAVAAKARKANKGEGKKKKKGEDDDEFDEMTSDKKLNSSLSQKLKRKSGGSPKKG